MGRVLVIGAGASGISAIKSCVEEGHDAVCYEACDAIGGLWRFTEEESHSSVYRSTIINTSKEMMAFSDFPIPRDFPPFMPHHKIIEYFNLYVDHFGLRGRIVFSRRVEAVRRALDYDQTGRHTVTSFDAAKNERVTEIFDAVIVASGHHWKPNVAVFPGQEHFKGRLAHSHGYKDPAGLEGKNVVVVGIGNSGVDLAVEVSRVAKQVYLATRSGTWLANRVFGGLPADFAANTRLTFLLPLAWRQALAVFFLGQMNPMLDKYGLQPTHAPLSAHPTINGELVGRIVVGAVTVKPNIKQFTGAASLEFDDGTRLDDVDAVILCTGYEIDFPFIDAESTGFRVRDNEVTLYKYIFPPPPKGEPEKKSWATLSFLGLIQPWGAIMPISEMQARWVAQALAGRLTLPPGREMWRDISAKREEMRQRYKGSKRHTIQVDYVPYMDELAEQIGVSPSFWRLFFHISPLFALHALVGPVAPPLFRLFGHGRWDGARRAYNELLARNFYPTQTRVVTTARAAARRGFANLRSVLLIVLALLVLRRLFRSRK